MTTARTSLARRLTAPAVALLAGTGIALAPGIAQANTAAGTAVAAAPVAAPNQAEVTSMAARQQFGDGAGFAMPPHAKHDAFVSPFHEATAYRIPSSRAAIRRACVRSQLDRTSRAHRQ